MQFLHITEDNGSYTGPSSTISTELLYLINKCNRLHIPSIIVNVGDVTVSASISLNNNPNISRNLWKIKTHTHTLNI